MESSNSPERWRRVEAVFTAALDREPTERDAFLAMACDGDPALRAEVESLLAAHERTGVLERMADQIAPLTAGFSRDPLLEGRTVGPYSVKQRVGGGGMGVVHEAYDQRLDRTVALKFLQAQFGMDSVAADRFRLEARTVAALEHPNICTVHEIGETEDGLLYLAMPLYDGETVQQRINHGPLTVELAVTIAMQVLRGLAKAHARGIIHRDVKPSNVFITSDAVVKLLDFGIAKLADVTLTGTSAGPIGTLAYMSPEQALGAPLDARTDIWSVGVMLYEMLSGQRPYASGAAAAMGVDPMRPAPLSLRALRPDVSPALEQTVMKALEREAGNRYQSATEFERALGALGLATISGDAASSAAPRGAITESNGRGGPLRLFAAAAFVGLAALGAWYVFDRPGSDAVAGVAAEATAKTVAVLPFADRSDSGDQGYFTDGMTEELISTLSRVDGLRVASATSVFAYRANTADVRDIGRKLGVAYVVEGSLRRSGDQLRITATLVNVADGIRLWTREFDRTTGDAFVLQQEIAQEVARALQVRLVIGNTDTTSTRPDADAYELYLKGRFAWATRTEASMRTALRFFEQAAETDPKYAPALVGMADAYAVMAFYDYLRPADAFPKAEAAARKALELDPSLAAPHATLGYAALYYHWDLADGEADFRKAIALNDDYATAHQWHANLLAAAGRFDESVAEMRRAYQIDPLSLIARAAEGWVHSLAGHDSLALVRHKEVLQQNPDFQQALNWQGFAYLGMDSIPQAIASHRKLLALADSSGLNIATLAHTLAVANQREEATRLLDVLLSRDASGKYVPSYEVAKVYVALGKPADALAWLEKARAQRSHSMVFLRVDPQLASLRNDPRFRALEQQVFGKS